MLHQAGYLLVVVTNQGGVAQGSITEGNLADIEVALRIRLASANIPLAGFYYCPHHPDGLIPRYSIHCSCRKPQSGLLHQAARELRIDLERSWMIGDILHDVEAGRSAGCRTVLLTNGNETEWDMSASPLAGHPGRQCMGCCPVPSWGPIRRSSRFRMNRKRDGNDPQARYALLFALGIVACSPSHPLRPTRPTGRRGHDKPRLPGDQAIDPGMQGDPVDLAGWS